jgi:predicted phosphodiesterase
MYSAIKKALCGLSLMLALSVFSTSAFAGVLKKPYMIYEGQNPTMTVLWQDNAVENDNTISWGTDTGYGLGSVTVPGYGPSNQHKYMITGLAPSTKYYYKVAAADGTVYGTGSFLTAPENDAKSVKFLAFGDTRSGPLAMEGVIQEMRKVYAVDPAYQSINIQAGDWVSSDAESSWTTQWFNNNAETVALLSEQPINGVKGNHENASGYSKYYPKYYPFPYVNAQPKAGDPLSFNNLYYSFDYGPVHFTVVDQYSTYTVGSAQYNWVVNDLATTTKPWKILVYHEPAWTAGTHGNNTTTQRIFDPLIKQYGVDLVYAGHNHNYARCQFNDGDNTVVPGVPDSIIPKVPYITNGGGGAGLYAVDTTNTGSYRHVRKAISEYEYMTFDVNDKTLTMNVYAVYKDDGVQGSKTRLSGTSLNAATKSTLIETVVINHPAADAGNDVTIGTREQCATIITGAASDADNEPLMYRWLDGETEVLPLTAVGVNGEASLDLCKVSSTIGQHVLNLEVTDGQAKASDGMVLTIVDTTPPTLTANANKTVLWPPLHDMENISIDTNTQDNSGAKPTISAVVASNEPENGLDDGDTGPDWTEPVIDQASGKISLQLRAERSGIGSGRAYTVAVTATDAVGNATTVPVKVSVPLSMGN